LGSLEEKTLIDLSKARQHLSYSYNKVRHFNFETEWSESELEVLESFSSRFARYSDLIVSRFLVLSARKKDPAFRGSAIDLLNLAEKFGWISSAIEWRRIRELRNVAAHEYSADDYKSLYKELVKLCPLLLEFNPQKCV
jgi:hypothetical protein